MRWTFSWYSGSTFERRSSIVSAIGPTTLSQAFFISAVMSTSAGLPFTGNRTTTGCFESPTKLCFSFHSRTMWIEKRPSGAFVFTSFMSCSSIESPACVSVRWSSSVG